MSEKNFISTSSVILLIIIMISTIFWISIDIHNRPSTLIIVCIIAIGFIMKHEVRDEKSIFIINILSVFTIVLLTYQIMIDLKSENMIYFIWSIIEFSIVFFLIYMTKEYSKDKRELGN